mmetsp:Transcript_55839/g.109313  ORF Transcript_55839/g.109313 Transcript_55839/m.109313 type:complete len:226 (-) Transcript_55839:514-1191(-)
MPVSMLMAVLFSVPVAVSVIVTVRVVVSAPLSTFLFLLRLDLHKVLIITCQEAPCPPSSQKGRWNSPPVRGDCSGVCVYSSHALPDLQSFVGSHQINLVEDDFVCEENLLECFIDSAGFQGGETLGHPLKQTMPDVAAVHECHDSLKPKLFADGRRLHECAHNWHWICHPCGLNHNRVKGQLSLSGTLRRLHDCLECPQQVAPHRAAHAAVVHHHNLFCRRKLRC